MIRLCLLPAGVRTKRSNILSRLGYLSAANAGMRWGCTPFWSAAAGRLFYRHGCGSDGCDTIGSFCGAVDGFDEGDAAAALEAVACRGAVLLDGLEKIFEDGLVAAEIADDGGRGALVFVEGGGFGGGGWDVSEIGGDDAVVFEDDGAFGAGDFDAAGVAGIGGGGGVKYAQGAAGEFEDGNGGVFGFDLVELNGGSRLNANHIT